VTKNTANMPSCPKCDADGCYVKLVVIVVYDKTGTVRTELACDVCGHGWSVMDPGKPS
jgi:hypothetical protein